MVWPSVYIFYSLGNTITYNRIVPTGAMFLLWDDQLNYIDILMLLCHAWKCGNIDSRIWKKRGLCIGSVHEPNVLTLVTPTANFVIGVPKSEQLNHCIIALILNYTYTETVQRHNINICLSLQRNWTTVHLRVCRRQDIGTFNWPDCRKTAAERVCDHEDGKTEEH